MINTLETFEQDLGLGLIQSLERKLTKLENSEINLDNEINRIYSSARNLEIILHNLKKVFIENIELFKEIMGNSVKVYEDWLHKTEDCCNEILTRVNDLKEKTNKKE